MSESTIRKPADYLESGYIYQIQLRSFTPEGTLNSAEKMLPYIKSIGAAVVYLCPCFGTDDDPDVAGWSDRQRKSGVNNAQNPYRISDYFNIDPEYGTMDDLKSFVAAAHALDLKVILDLVYFHCGPRAVFLAEHPEFIIRDEDGKPALGQWRFPKLNYDSAELREYMWQNMELYVRDCDVDGYRCDVGAAVPLDFWMEGRRRIDAIKPDLMMLCEGTDPNYLAAFDLNYSWMPRGEIYNCVANGAPASNVSDTLEKFNREHLQNTYHSILLLENHDTANDDYENRLEKRIGNAAMDAAFVTHFLMPNVPFVYNGTEVCDTNRHSIWASRTHGANLTIDWQNALTAEGKARMKLISTLAMLRRNIPVLGLYGAINYANSGCDSVLAYVRSAGENSSDERKIAVLVNLSGEGKSASTDIRADSIGPVLLHGAAVSVSSESGCICAALEPFGYAVVDVK